MYDKIINCAFICPSVRGFQNDPSGDRGVQNDPSGDHGDRSDPSRARGVHAHGGDGWPHARDDRSHHDDHPSAWLRPLRWVRRHT